MNRVQIVTDSTADIPAQLAEQLGITVVPLNVQFGRETYRDGVDLTADEFYRKLRSSPVLPTTSQPSVAAFADAYAGLDAAGGAILSIHLSAKLSGTYNAALLARTQYSGRARIEVVDSRLASLALGLVVIAAAKAARDGASVDDVLPLVNRLLPNVHIVFFVDTLEYLQKGGRIGRAQAMVGSLLSIKPVLKLEEGEIHPVEKVRTRSKAIDRLVEFVELFPTVDQMAVVHANAPGDVETLVGRTRRLVPSDRVLVGQIGAVIGTHVGPGGLGVIVQQGV